MKKKYQFTIYLGMVFLVLLTGCKKQDNFLNVKQSINQVQPQTLDDFQAIMDDYNQMNLGAYPDLGNVGDDNFYFTDAYLASITATQRNGYLWEKDVYQGAPGYSWASGYSVIEYCNITLDGLNKLNASSISSSQAEYNNVKGSALFYRTLAFYMLAEDFCKPYNIKTAGTDLGIVLRMTSDVTAKSTRSTVAQTYQQMISDIKTAIGLLPTIPKYQMRPSKPAANALLAKIYLEMGDYKNAEIYANSSLEDFNTLLDFNSSSVSPSGFFTFPGYPDNPEISFYSTQGIEASALVAAISASNVDSTLIKSYDSNDLRKTCFYYQRGDGTYGFKGTYSATLNLFCGIASDEVYLIRAESRARSNNLDGAKSDLNTLLIKRYVTGTYVPITTNDQTALLSKILLERRKELPFTGQLRWEDLRRLNQDPNNAIILTRVSKGVTYTLSPNDPRYVLPIPDQEIQLSGIQQNSR